MPNRFIFITKVGIKPLFLFIIISNFMTPNLQIDTVNGYGIADVLEDLEEIDFELLVRSYLPSKYPEIQDWLENETIVRSVTDIRSNILFYNIEDKDPSYKFLPLDEQDNMSNPAYITPLLLMSENGLERIENQYDYSGVFSLGINETIISLNQKPNLEWAYNRTLNLENKINCSIAINYTHFASYLHQFDPEHHNNVKIKCISEIKNSTTLLQKAFSYSNLYNSSIIILESLSEESKENLTDNGIFPNLFVKLKPEMLIIEGVANITKIVSNFVYLKLDVYNPTALHIIFEEALQEIIDKYNNAIINTTIISLYFKQILFSAIFIMVLRLWYKKRKD